MASKEVYPKDVIKALRKLGFSVIQRRGSHARLIHRDGRKTTIAVHPKPLSLGTLHSIFRQAELTREDLDDIL